MRLSQKTRNIIDGVIALIFISMLIFIYQYFIVNGDLFKITKIEKNFESDILDDVFSSVGGICEEKSIFGFNAKKSSDAIKKNLHCIKDVDIKKNLPDKVCVNITYRTPILRLSEKRYPTVIDETGKIYKAPIFNPSSDLIIPSIPILITEKANSYKPNDKLDSKTQTAVEIISKFNSVKNPGFRITQVDTQNDIYIILSSETNKQIYIAWEEITTEQEISDAINIAINGMNDGRKLDLSKLYILVKQKECHFTKL